jgi:hypothetical protein
MAFDFGVTILPFRFHSDRPSKPSGRSAFDANAGSGAGGDVATVEVGNGVFIKKRLIKRKATKPAIISHPAIISRRAKSHRFSAN